MEGTAQNLSRHPWFPFLARASTLVPINKQSGTFPSKVGSQNVPVIRWADKNVGTSHIGPGHNLDDQAKEGTIPGNLISCDRRSARGAQQGGGGASIACTRLQDPVRLLRQEQ